MHLKKSDYDIIQKSINIHDEKTKAVLVPVIYKSAHHYPVAHFRASFLFAASMLVFCYYFVTILNYQDLTCFLIFPLLAALFGYAITYIWPIKKMFILQTEIERKTKELSYELFYQLQIYSSNDRNGILIVCFENEQRVEVLADSEIAKLENSNYWNGIVQNLLVAMKSDRMIAGICATIEKLTQLQARKYPS